MTSIAYALFTLGCVVSLLNLYVTLIRYPLLRLRGVPVEDIGHVSGFPLIGSLLILLTLFAVSDPMVWWLGLSIGVFDTGGLHFFAVVMLVDSLRGKT